MKIKNRKKCVLILGGGISGLGAAQLAFNLGYEIKLSDLNPLNEEQKKNFEKLQAEVFCGKPTPDLLKDISKIILSPGISYQDEFLNLARAHKIEILSEIDFALQDYTGQIISVTGTNGKSTVCAMIRHIFENFGTAADLAGNFGTSPSSIKAERQLHENLILELSSYQLEQSFHLPNSVGIFTSFSNDHLARHKTLESYFRVKWKLSEMTKKLWLISQNVKDELINYAVPEPPCPQIVVQISSDFQNASGQKEPHNILNAKLASMSASEVLRVPALELANCLKTYVGLFHRCQNIGKFKNHKLIDDSKSTNVESTLSALESCSEKVILMLGGAGKGESYLPLLKHSKRISLITTFGKSGIEIFQELKDYVSCYDFKTCDKACEFVKNYISNHENPQDSSVVLFSPACASFDEFKNFEERGLFFQQAFLK